MNIRWMQTKQKRTQCTTLTVAVSTFFLVGSRRLPRRPVSPYRPTANPLSVHARNRCLSVLKTTQHPSLHSLTRATAYRHPSPGGNTHILKMVSQGISYITFTVMLFLWVTANYIRHAQLINCRKYLYNYVQSVNIGHILMDYARYRLINKC